MYACIRSGRMDEEQGEAKKLSTGHQKRPLHCLRVPFLCFAFTQTHTHTHTRSCENQKPIRTCCEHICKRIQSGIVRDSGITGNRYAKTLVNKHEFLANTPLLSHLHWPQKESFEREQYKEMKKMKRQFKRKRFINIFFLCIHSTVAASCMNIS